MSDNKKLKSRRSSILKPPKPRNPLSDVDLNPPTDITLKSRRVSFANVHFKKEFTADPEKNTIWHNSYEEEMNKSDKSDLSDGKTIQSVSNDEEDMNMSVQNMSLDSDVMNCTHLVNLDGSLGHNSSDSSGVIDLTKHSEREPVLPAIPIESENVCSDIKISGKRQTINFIQGSEDANMSMTTVFPVDIFSQNKRNTVLYNQMSEDEQNMEVTEYIPSNLVQNNIITNGQTIHCNKYSGLIENSENITSNLKENMPITPAVQFFKDTDNRRTVHFHSGSMDVTEHIPLNINQKTLQQSLHPENKSLTCKRFTILQHQMNEEEQNMNITENICAQMIAQQESTVPNKENALKQTIFLNQLQEQNMEITQNICANFVQNNENSKNRHTIHYNEGDIVNMDFTEIEKQSLDITEDISAKIQQSTLPKSQRQTILFNKMQDEEQNMEITQNMFTNFVHSSENTMNLETVHFNNPEIANVDITTSVPRSLIQKINQQRIPIENKENMLSSSQRRTILYNPLENEQNMEITQNISTNILQNNITPKNRQTIHFTKTDMGYMDITESIPVNLLQKLSQKNIPVEDKENVPSLIFYREQSREMTQNIYPSRETIHFNEPEMGNIDITESVPFISIKKQKLPVENKENICGISQIKSILQNEKQKEVTESIRRNIQNNRQTINFDDSDSGAIDITKSVPFSLIQKISQQKLAVEDKENMHSTSHSKLSYNETQEENMKVTQNITANIVQNSQKQKNRQTIHINESNVGSLDITETVPSNLVQKNIQPVQSEHMLNIYTNFASNSENKESVCNISEIKCVSRNEAQKEEILEITESIRDIQNNIKLKDRQTIHFDDSHSGAVDVTKSVPFSLIQKLSQQKLPVEDEENMHSTSHTKLSYNETQEEQNIEVTKNNTNIVQNSQKQKNQQTINFNESNMESMDVTENAPSNLVKEIIQPVQSEYTQHICTNFISNIENPSTIHYNETQMDNTEVTENVPANLLQKFMQQFPFEDKEEQNECLINLTDALDLTPVNNQLSFNITANLTSLVDSTEKLINCKIGLPTSEYSKIITDNIDKNYSIVNTSIPENLDFSDVTISDNCQKMDSIISVNSSTESVEYMDEWKKMLNKVKPPPEIHYFDVNELLATLPPPSLDEDIKLLKNWVSCPLSINERAKKYLNIDLDKYDKLKQETINFNVPQRQLEEEKPNAVFDRIKFFLENKQQSLEFQKELTLTDKIKRMASKDKLWYFVPNTEFSFIFMKNIKFDVQMVTNSEIVQKFCSTIDESKLNPIGLYVFEKLKPKLKEEKLKSCIGAHYTIFSFLDYLTQISEGLMDNINDFNDLVYKYGLRVDEDLNATLLFTNTSLPLAFEIRFILNDLDHISADSIKINQLVCSADENALKRLVKFCPTGIEFIRAYHRSVSDYLKILQRSKLK